MVTVAPRRYRVHVGSHRARRRDARLRPARLRRLAVGIPAASSVAPVLAVGFRVLRKVVGTHEPFIAERTSEPLLACVGPKVPLQLVGPGEALAAEKPVTDEGSLASVPPEVRLQVARLAVHLAAPRDVAVVDVLLSQTCACGTEPFSFLTVWAVASDTPCVTSLGSWGRHTCHRST